MSPDTIRVQNLTLLGATLVVAICGLVYELLIGALSSYLLGDSVYAFSLVIGLFMTAMGVGSWLSRFARDALADNFVRVQLGIGFGGGLAPLILFYVFAQFDSYQPFLFVITFAIGILIGLEIPLVLRLIERHKDLRINISNVLTADYAGALVASLLFPLVLVPQLGLLRTGLFFGLLNLAVAALAAWVFRHELLRPKRLFAVIALAAAILTALYIGSNTLSKLIEDKMYSDEILYSESSSYQRIVVTRNDQRFRLFLDGALQFDSLDEYRYHESLVHPAMALSERRANVLILGGGDGLAVREVLRWPDVEAISLVDLDPSITKLFKDNRLLQPLNKHALEDAKVTVHNTDAWKFLEDANQFYDVVIIDLPDPRVIALSRLYSKSFYRLVADKLAIGGMMVTQATSPLYAREAFWCIEETVAATKGFNTLPYHAYVPSFGEWGFVLASRKNIHWQTMPLPDGMKFLDQTVLKNMPRFPTDMSHVETEANHIGSHALLRYYEQGWEKWYQ